MTEIKRFKEQLVEDLNEQIDIAERAYIRAQYRDDRRAQWEIRGQMKAWTTVRDVLVREREMAS